MVQLLNEELKAYSEIRTIAEAQNEVLDNDNIEDFNSLLLKRGELIDEITELQQMKNVLLKPCNQSTSNEDDQSNDVDKILEKIRDELTKCAKINDKQMDIIKSKTEVLTKKIDDQSTRRKGIGGYVQAVPNESDTFDEST